jgi:hypothetical protein
MITDAFTRLGARSHVGDNGDRERPVDGEYDVIAGGFLCKGRSPLFVPGRKEAGTNNRITFNI